MKTTEQRITEALDSADMRTSQEWMELALRCMDQANMTAERQVLVRQFLGTFGYEFMEDE